MYCSYQFLMDTKRRTTSKREPGSGEWRIGWRFGRMEELIHDGTEPLLGILSHVVFLWLCFIFSSSSIQFIGSQNKRGATPASASATVSHQMRSVHLPMAIVSQQVAATVATVFSRPTSSNSKRPVWLDCVVCSLFSMPLDSCSA